MITKRKMKAVSAFVLAASLAACGAGDGAGSLPGSGTPGTPGSGTPPSTTPPVESVSFVNDDMEANRFLVKAGWGGSQADLDALVNTDAEDWVAAEMAKSATFTLPDVLALPRDSNGNAPFNQTTYLYWDHIVTADDELRQRMAFALSQIFVFSDIANQSRQDRRAYYQDLLIRNAFGNYRELIDEITYSPAMAVWLTYWRNRKGDERTGRMPDENYAREILQLFSIGVVELNMDGSPRLDGQGREIETYNNDDIVGLAKVFTGLTGKGETFWRSDDDADYK